MPSTIDTARSSSFWRRMKYACGSCKYSSALFLLVAGALTMTFVSILLGVEGGMLWRYGWLARLIGIVLFCTVPFVISNVVKDYRDTYDEQSVVQRRAWAGASLLGLGALLILLAIGELFLVLIFASLRNH
jgi:hypothetical protein